MKKLLLGLLLVPTLALAQSEPAPQQKEFKFILSQQDLVVISQYLGQAPYDRSATVIVKMQKQLQDQQKLVEPAPKE